jgi:hypothetical protein
MKRLIMALSLIGLGILLATTPMNSFAGSLIPLPEDIEIVPAAPNLVPEIAAFLGEWKGTWESGRDCVLIVEKINDQKAKVIYAWGDDKNCPERSPKGFRRYSAKVISGTPTIIEFNSGETKFTFKMQRDLKSLKGLWETPSAYGKGKMKRIAE